MAGRRSRAIQPGSWPLYRLPLLLLTPALLVTFLVAGGGSALTAIFIPHTVGPAAAAATWFVRPDGGSAQQCTGLVDAPYPGEGSSRPCAWDHPFRALPPGGPARIAAGDTLIVATGAYMMGYGAPETVDCDPVWPGDCHMAPIPSGPNPANPTRILGAAWDSGCVDAPELWGTERAEMVLNLTDSSNVEVSCLELTDHSACVDDHANAMGGSALTCKGDAPFGPWASHGLYAEDSANVHLRDLDIHGFAGGGVHAGRLTDWTVEDVRIAANGWVGWDGDLGWEEDSSNSGTMRFRRWTVEWNGCAETYPGGKPTGCWAQTAGGYGDGIGTAATGADWIIEDSAFLHNTSDGLDLFYHTLGGSITVNRVRAEGNAGQQIKITGQSTITNSALVGNCAYFEGKSFTYNVDPCRALGNTLEVVYTGGEQVSIVNSTFYGQGDGLVLAGPRGDGLQCDGSETLTGQNNVFLGDTDFFDPGDITFLFYQTECLGIVFQGDYNIAHNVKNTGAPHVSPTYPSAHNLLLDPLLAGPLSGDTYNIGLTAGSPAIDAGTSAGCPPIDLLGAARPADGDGDGSASCDLGAYEYGASPPAGTPAPTLTTPVLPTAPPGPGWADAAVNGWNNLPWLGADNTGVGAALAALAMPGGSSIRALWRFIASGQDWLRNLYFPDGSSSIQINAVSNGETFWALVDP